MVSFDGTQTVEAFGLWPSWRTVGSDDSPSILTTEEYVGLMYPEIHGSSALVEPKCPFIGHGIT